MLMPNKIALADLKLRAHHPEHLVDTHMLLTQDLFTFLRRDTRERYRGQKVLPLFDQIDDRDAKAGALVDRSDHLLQNLVKPQFRAQQISQADELFDLLALEQRTASHHRKGGRGRLIVFGWFG